MTISIHHIPYRYPIISCHSEHEWRAWGGPGAWATIEIDSLHEGMDFYTSCTRARFEVMRCTLNR